MILREVILVKVVCILLFVLWRIVIKFIIKYYDNIGVYLNIEYGDLVNFFFMIIYFILLYLIVVLEVNWKVGGVRFINKLLISYKFFFFFLGVFCVKKVVC